MACVLQPYARMQRRSDTRAHLSPEEPDRWVGMIREPAVEQCCQMRVLEHLVQQIAERVGRALERMGLLQRDAESALPAPRSRRWSSGSWRM